MAITQAVKTAMKKLQAEDKLLHTAAQIALESCEPINFNFNGITAFRSMMEKLESFDRQDIGRHIAFMGLYPELRLKWLGTIIRLTPEQFSLHIPRIRRNWSRIKAIPGIIIPSAWDVLIGYPDADPGDSLEQADSVFLINAALLSAAFSANDEQFSYKFTTSTVYCHKDYTDIQWELEEISGGLLELALERPGEAEAIAELIIDKSFWEPEALRYWLDGGFPEPSNEATSLMQSMVKDICDNAKHEPTDPDAAGSSFFEDLGYRGVGLLNVREALDHVTSAYHRGDLDFLRTRYAIIESYRQEKRDQKGNGLVLLVEDLRAAGYAQVTAIIDRSMLDRFITMHHAIDDEDYYPSPRSIYREGSGTEVFRQYVRALRTAVAIGPNVVIEYLMEDRDRAMDIVGDHGLTDYEDLIEHIQKVLHHGVLAGGIL